MYVIRSFLLCLVALLAVEEAFGQRPEFALQSMKPEPESLYTLQFSLPSPLAAGAAIRLDFPPGFDLSSTKIAGSQQVPGGLAFEVDSLHIILKRTGLGPELPAGRQASIIFGPVKRRRAPAVADSVQITFPAGPNFGDSGHQASKVRIR